ncbi:MAG: hypothetical protein WC989_09410 [Micavibrio sp.]
MRIFRISNLLLFAVAAFLGFLLFWTSQAVQNKEDQYRTAKKKLAQETETIRVLSVEWDYLNRPQRLEELAAEIGMVPSGPSSMIKNASHIPEPVIEADPFIHYQEGITQAVSLSPIPPPVKKPAAAAEKLEREGDIISPSSAERQSFERLIEQLNAPEREGR